MVGGRRHRTCSFWPGQTSFQANYPGGGAHAGPSPISTDPPVPVRSYSLGARSDSDTTCMMWKVRVREREKRARERESVVGGHSPEARHPPERACPFATVLSYVISETSSGSNAATPSAERGSYMQLTTGNSPTNAAGFS